ncbi:fungal-specific transcription factor domain-containing protein [Lineolata rhizophorae]|uniref:Fungal-specific transcription factor domain-containing protein n=1 Tax=Lineolata rhizophorae TaxID=578093 RepID=A0A6A6P9A3_9PEZI|nr:fungal-specific transcription factor domain-containing protein [Lineolata rhizophorae]
MSQNSKAGGFGQQGSRKSRNGCHRCKLKRLKCDEKKPKCNNCESRGVECPGYSKLFKWSTKYETFQPAQLEVRTKAPLPQDNIDGLLQQASKAIKDDEGVKDTKDAGTPLILKENDASKEPDSSTKEASKSTSPPSPMENQSKDQPMHEKDHEEEQIENPDDEAMEDEEEEVLPRSQSSDLIEARPEPRRQSNALAEISRQQADEMRASRSLLRRFYRMHNLSSSFNLTDFSSVLVEHYFKYVASLYSSFDSSLNPFRATVGRLWDSSSSIYFAIQSMAAAHLANSNPDMKVVGLEMQRKSYRSLQNELQLVNTGRISSDRILLTILLLGLSTCWHDSGDLGLSHLAAARSLMYPRLVQAGPPQDRRSERQEQFFEESMIYWEMLIGFVSQDSRVQAHSMWESALARRASLSPERDTSPQHTSGSERKFLPHPWTGVAPRIQMLFAEVGRLIQRYRASGLQDDIEALELARFLEEELLDASLPPVDALVDPGDLNTSPAHFLAVAEGYRCSGLLELYRVFPHLLRQRLGTSSASSDPHAEDLGLHDFPSLPILLERHDRASDTRTWLTSLALHILSTLETIPPSSGTCSIQPILFVTAGSELRFSSSLDSFDPATSDEKIARARRFVEGRLNAFMLRLPSAPLIRMLELVKEVWRRSDGVGVGGNRRGGGRDVFWMDVMVERGWQTLMG